MNFFNYEVNVRIFFSINANLTKDFLLTGVNLDVNNSANPYRVQPLGVGSMRGAGTFHGSSSLGLGLVSGTTGDGAGMVVGLMLGCSGAITILEKL